MDRPIKYRDEVLDALTAEGLLDKVGKGNYFYAVKITNTTQENQND